MPECSNVTVTDYISVDADLQTTCEVSVKDIADTVKEGDAEQEDDNEGGDDDTGINQVSLADARAAIRTVTNFLLTHTVDETSLDRASFLEQEIEKGALKDRKQTTIMDFFKK